MHDLELSIGIGRYDRTQALLDGRVGIDGVQAQFTSPPLEELFARASIPANSSWRSCRSAISLPEIARRLPLHRTADLSLANVPALVDIRAHRPQNPHTARPHWAHGRSARVFHDCGPGRSRRARRRVRRGARIDSLALRAGRSGRFAADHPCATAGGRSRAHRSRPKSVRSSGGWPDRCDGGVYAAALLCRWRADVRRLFPEPMAVEQDYFARTGIFPIMHLIGIRKDIVEKHPEIITPVLNAFNQAKRVAIDALAAYQGACCVVALGAHGPHPGYFHDRCRTTGLMAWSATAGQSRLSRGIRAGRGSRADSSTSRRCSCRRRWAGARSATSIGSRLFPKHQQ